MPIQLPFVKFSNIMLKNEEAFETAKEAKNPNQNFDYSLLQNLFLISVLLILVYMVYSILLNIYFFSFFCMNAKCSRSRTWISWNSVLTHLG